MNLRDLEYLVALADLRSFGAAARRCFVSQPTLSGQIKKLETALGVRLFERTHKQVMPTETGQAVAAAARRVLREAEGIRDIAASSLDPFSGRFRLGAFPTLYFRAATEERLLRTTLGPAYDAYAQRVPMLIPLRFGR